MFVRILTACKRGVNGGASSCEPFRSELTQATFALASQSSALHGSCQPMEGRSLRAYRSGSVKGPPRWNARPWRAVDLATATCRSLDTLARAVLLERPDPHFQTGTANQFKARRIFFSSSSIVAFMVNARDEGVASTKEARAEEGPCVLPLERLHFNPTPVSRADDSARIKFVWTAIMLISPPRIDTDETRIAENQNFLTL